jgi:hypothetical protein
MNNLCAEKMISIAYNWNKNDIHDKLIKLNKLYNNDRIAFTIRRNPMGNKDLFGVDIIISCNGYINSSRSFSELSRYYSNLKDIWGYIKQLSKSKWIFTKQNINSIEGA